MYHAREVTSAEASDLYSLVQNLAHNASLPMPRVYIVDTAMPNAFATGRDPEHAAVAVTTGIIGILNRNELGGVVAHELAHAKNRDTLISTIAATIIQLAISRGREFGADASGAKNCGNPCHLPTLWPSWKLVLEP